MTKLPEGQPFIAIIVPGPGGELTGKQLPEGFMFILHESAQKETAVMVMTKISMKHMDARCVCGNPQCNLTLRFRIEKSGRHPLMEERG